MGARAVAHGLRRQGRNRQTIALDDDGVRDRDRFRNPDSARLRRRRAGSTTWSGFDEEITFVLGPRDALLSHYNLVVRLSAVGRPDDASKRCPFGECGVLPCRHELHSLPWTDHCVACRICVYLHEIAHRNGVYAVRPRVLKNEPVVAVDWFVLLHSFPAAHMASLRNLTDSSRGAHDKRQAPPSWPGASPRSSRGTRSIDRWRSAELQGQGLGGPGVDR